MAKDEDLMLQNDRLRAENNALRKELNDMAMRHMIDITEITGGYDKDMDEASWPGYTNFKLRKQIMTLEQELAKWKAIVMQQAIVKGYGG